MSLVAEWIAVDWGTSRLRAWAMQGETVLAKAQSEQGMARVTAGGFEAALLTLVEPWLGSERVDVLACGMVGARQGWVEAPYVGVPAKPVELEPVQVPASSSRLRAFVMPGLKQAQPSDVMRGEETQIAGYLADNPHWDGVICLPGTHTKWVHASAGEVISFQTCLSGEMFDLLSNASVLRHSIGTGFDMEAFDAALDESLSRPGRLSARLFGLRARDLLTGASPDAARAELSGLLIGAELAGAKPYWLGQEVVTIGSEHLAALYARALKQQGVPVRNAPADDMTLKGLCALRTRQQVRA
ncbi:MAG: 2-dehydro-3-deoxygalactonokinase [Arenibacterium sp.]